MTDKDELKDELLNEFLGDTTRASEWRALRDALRERLSALMQQRTAESVPALEAQIAALRKQVAALETEEVVAQFVEDSIKVSLARAPGDFGESDFGDGDFGDGAAE